MCSPRARRTLFLPSVGGQPRELVDEGKQLGLHVLAELGDEFDPLGSQGLEELLGDVATVAEELSGESLRHRGDGAAVVGVARGGPDPQQVATVTDDQVQLESEEPPTEVFSLRVMP